LLGSGLVIAIKGCVLAFALQLKAGKISVGIEMKGIIYD